MKVSLVGAGPGDPGLFTLKGQQLLARADVVVYDALASASLLDFANKGAELIYVGKVAGAHALPQKAINELLVEKAKANGGQNVVRLKGGDPYIFGRGGEEAEFLVAHGIPFEEIPGVSSAIAAPAYAGIPLTHRGYASSLTIVTGHEDPNKKESAHNWKAMAQSDSTLVFVMGMKNLPAIAAKLVENGMPPDRPAAIIYRGTTSMQRVLTADIESLPQKAASANFSNPSIIVVGKVVSLRGKLAWFEQKPLLGRRIVVTRAREQASSMAAQLEELGAEVIQCPTIAIRPMGDYSLLEKALDKIGIYDWIIFTSVNGVKYFREALEKRGLDSRALAHANLATIGPATADELARMGLRADLVPSSYVAEELSKSLVEREGKTISGKHVLVARAANARMALPDALRDAGCLVDVAPVYETAPAGDCMENVVKMLENGEIDCISFASSSTVENFLAALPGPLRNVDGKPALAAIGPVTAATLAKHGLSPQIEPADFTIPGLVGAITDYFIATKS